VVGISYHKKVSRPCADFAHWPRQKVDAVIEFVKTLERAADVGRLTAMVTS